jgi:hypothetical protein
MSTGYHADEIVFVRREKAGPVASAWEFRQRIGATELATPFSGEKAFQPTIAHVAATRPAVHALGMKRIIRRYPAHVDQCRYCSGVGLVKDFNRAPHLKWS